jgi:hypothetical protein
LSAAAERAIVGAEDVMWTAHVTEIGRGTTLRYAVTRGLTPVSFVEVIAAWQGDPEFGKWFNAVLEAVPFSSFRWETPALTRATAGRVFEFAVLDSPELDRAATPDPFQEHFDGDAKGPVLTFSNLGGDAVLVVPRPLAATSAYGHIGAFVRAAPETQRQGLWRAVGQAMSHRIGARPVWLSTAGAGVPWLHVRLDDRPKYYTFAPFRASP